MSESILLRQSLMLIFLLVVTYTVAAIGSIASISAQTFYQQLMQPSWAPPAWLFGPVWTVLYTLMAVAAWLVWRSTHPNKKQALILYAVQLVFNGLWSWLFFAWSMGGLAFAEILLLWCLILFTMVCFWRCNKVAGALIAPYLAWVSFATLLNGWLWQANPGVL